MNKTEKETVLTQTEKRARSEEQRKALHQQIIFGMRQKYASIMRMSRNKVRRLQAKAVWTNFMQSDGKLLQTDGSNFWFIRKEDLGVIWVWNTMNAGAKETASMGHGARG